MEWVRVYKRRERAVSKLIRGRRGEEDGGDGGGIVGGFGSIFGGDFC